MYKNINSKLLLFERIFLLLRFIFIIFIVLLFVFSLKKTFFIRISREYSNKKNINTELVTNPIIQINYVDDNSLTYIVSNSAIVKNDYNEITLNNVKVYNDFFEANSKTVVYKDNTVFLKDRPVIFFYNNL